MHLSLLLSTLLTTTVLATDLVHGSYQRNALFGLAERQLQICSPVDPGPNLCARSCGAGYEPCVYEDMCFKPSDGDVCCSSGWYCAKGSYCVSGNNCCPDGLSTEQCAASIGLSSVPAHLSTLAGGSVLAPSGSSVPIGGSGVGSSASIPVSSAGGGSRGISTPTPVPSSRPQSHQPQQSHQQPQHTRHHPQQSGQPTPSTTPMQGNGPTPTGNPLSSSMPGAANAAQMGAGVAGVIAAGFAAVFL